jgi:hypothetical protein
MRAPVSTVTPGPKTTCGSTTASRPITVSAEKITLSGQVSVTPSSIARFRNAAWKRASARARPARESTPSVSSSGQRTTPAERPAARASGHDIRQVVFARRVGRFGPAEMVQQFAASAAMTPELQVVIGKLGLGVRP